MKEICYKIEQWEDISGIIYLFHTRGTPHMSVGPQAVSSI